ncbi:histidine phosphatase family protein [Pseudomonas sp. B2021]|uniref:Phosphoglycerate mutase family protein n=1 Tax=Pseudomonas lactis TaxID=1615674 RepID=I4K5M2_9PSED|nr:MULTISPECIES: histidine phosphatase family protein [Pseudomonas]EIK60012.1 phosphoglycerate mutase family protein [Pseudomonas lactis]MBD8558242.1 histidine phosphatase family protein [Pseudomonas fluorescens]MBR7213461.1 histidine phosphatase family protein [Pseudomonas sp. B2021]NNA49499.1 histidine phosphatase family protein [Pseudomonas lactis]
MPATRLTLICHAITPLQKQGRFPDDESVTMDWQGAALSLAGRYKQQARLLCGPEARTRQSAGLFGDNAQVDLALRDLDVGAWKGQRIGQLDSATLNTWATDSASAVHGGESVGQLCIRVGQWLNSLETHPGHVIAVTHPFVIRAAMLSVMQLPISMFYRIDVEPLSATELRFNGVWRLRLETSA